MRWPNVQDHVINHMAVAKRPVDQVGDATQGDGVQRQDFTQRLVPVGEEPPIAQATTTATPTIKISCLTCGGEAAPRLRNAPGLRLSSNAKLIGFEPILKLLACSETGTRFTSWSIAMKVMPARRAKLRPRNRGDVLKRYTFLFRGGRIRRLKIAQALYPRPSFKPPGRLCSTP